MPARSGPFRVRVGVCGPSARPNTGASNILLWPRDRGMFCQTHGVWSFCAPHGVRVLNPLLFKVFCGPIAREVQEVCPVTILVSKVGFKWVPSCSRSYTLVSRSARGPRIGSYAIVFASSSFVFRWNGRFGSVRTRFGPFRPAIGRFRVATARLCAQGVPGRKSVAPAIHVHHEF